MFATIGDFAIVKTTKFRFPTVEVFATMIHRGDRVKAGFRFPTVEVFATMVAYDFYNSQEVSVPHR